MPFPHLALPTTRIHRALIALSVFLLLSGWVIHLVSLSILQNAANNGPPYDFLPPFLITDVSPSRVLSLDWWFWCFFTFTNIYCLIALATDRTGGVAKNRIPMSVYPAIAAVFCTYRIHDMIWREKTSTVKALVSAYFIQGIPYYVLPLLYGTSFLNTSADVGHLRDMESSRGNSGRYGETTQSSV